MKVVIATCFESNEERVSFVLEACKKRKYNAKVITTGFSHIKKQKRTNIPKDYLVVETKPYNKNLSIKRMKSHSKFAKDTFKLIEQETPDLIWLMAPANSLIKEAKKYKKKYPATKLIIDIIDMWPESLPLGISSSIFPLNIWRNVRRNSIDCADTLVTECDFYHEILNEEYEKNITTIHWARESKVVETKTSLPKDRLSLCYIGSINNIIGTTLVSEIIDKCDMPIVLHVIGEGENRYNFVNLNSRVCEVIYHGAIRDEEEKNRIFNKCHAGLNIYKNDLYIGLTVKSIDYFEHGLPVINNIKGDTWSMIEKYNVGINIKDDEVLHGEDIIKMRKNNKNVYKLFNDNFTKEVFIEKCYKVIDGVIK